MARPACKMAPSPTQTRTIRCQHVCHPASRIKGGVQLVGVEEFSKTLGAPHFGPQSPRGNTESSVYPLSNSLSDSVDKPSQNMTQAEFSEHAKLAADAGEHRDRGGLFLVDRPCLDSIVSGACIVPIGRTRLGLKRVSSPAALLRDWAKQGHIALRQANPAAWLVTVGKNETIPCIGPLSCPRIMDAFNILTFCVPRVTPSPRRYCCAAFAMTS
jgi:hypothetical protein